MSEKKYLKEDKTLETLLDLDGEIFPMENGYWTKFEASRVTPTQKIPHGIRYPLTYMIEIIHAFWDLIMLMLLNLRRKNMGLVKSPWTTNTKGKQFFPMNLNLPVSY